MIKLAVILLMLFLILLSYGAKTLMDANAYKTPQTMSYKQFSEMQPVRGWVHIKACRFDLLQAVVETHSNVPARAFVPVFDARDSRQRTTHVYAEMNDDNTKVLFIDMEQQKRFHSPQEYQAWKAAHRAEFTIRRDLDGLAREGIGLRTMQNLEGEFGKVADASTDSLSVVAEGWKPNPSLGKIEIALSGVGIALMALWIGKEVRDRRSS